MISKSDLMQICQELSVSHSILSSFIMSMQMVVVTGLLMAVRQWDSAILERSCVLVTILQVLLF